MLRRAATAFLVSQSWDRQRSIYSTLAGLPPHVIDENTAGPAAPEF
ncbi:hypothetical protein [Saccharopolyspora erythraea]|nr:hypothetical protein [Saccharopolyspora erythraea]